ncbi:hypothetical protein EKO27_g7585 [Xylaria grammica]|uniref:Uncharacterized protein n=1 Tax=Xylaria grammica TaxID=363999 RepID=A0A439CZ94_9PEZI|nr:hypothetical protein EKO27_g7585 [Xylaria grammica]
MLESWAVELWGSPTQLFLNVKSSKVSKDTMDQLKGTIETYVKSAKDLFGLSLDDDEAFISSDQEPPAVQELYLGNSPTFGVGDRMQPADSEVATSLEIMFFEDPPDIPSDLQYSIMLATYLLAGATFTILLLFLQGQSPSLNLEDIPLIFRSPQGSAINGAGI